MARARWLGALGPLVVVLALLLFTAQPLDAATPRSSASGPLTLSSPLALDTDVASDGTNFLAVWTQFTGTSSGKREVYGALINGAGKKVLVPIGSISSSADGKDDELPKVAWNGSHYLVVWQQAFGANDVDILARRIDSAGSPVGNIFKVATPTGSQLKPVVTASGSTFFAAWDDDRTGAGDIRGGRITDVGALLDGDGGVLLAGDSRFEDLPDVAGSTAGFFLVYELHFSSTDIDVYGRAISSTGEAGVAVPLATGSDIEEDASVASDGSQFLAVWGNEQSTTDKVDIQGIRIQNGATVGGFIAVSNAQNGQSEPDIAFNVTFLAIWRDTRNGHSGIFGTRITTAGAVQEPDGFPIWDNQETGGGSAANVSRGPGSQKWGVGYDNALSEGSLFRTASSK